ncbi:MAG: hypothetical protein AB1Z65_13705, partial [Candidatus Sulfomarinibacteraceae bacterium]
MSAFFRFNLGLFEREEGRVMKGHRLIVGFLVLALVVLAPQTLLAQSDANTGQLFGTVTDPDGA